MLRISIVALSLLSLPVAAEEWATPESKARWNELTKLIYGANARPERTGREVTIEAPPTAQDAALVPVAIGSSADFHAEALDLVIDQNPSPIAARVAFGPAGDPRLMRFRVRVDGFTNVHAVAKSGDGKLAETVAFVQAAGGCSAPVGAGNEDASANMGEMRMKFGTEASLAGAPKATLMIRHPNFNGMQMDQKTHAYVPARYIKSIAVTRGGTSVFSMQADISLSTNPVIEFLYAPGRSQPFEVTVVDTTGASWTRQFDTKQAVN